MGAQIATLFSTRLLRAARARGIDVQPIARAAGLTGPLDETRPISEAKHLSVWERLMRSSDDPGLPIFYAEHISIDDYGVLGLASKTAARLGDALSLVCTHLAAYTDSLELQLQRGPSTSRVICRRAGPLTLGRRVSTESTLAEVLAAARSLTGVALQPRSITFRHAAFDGVAAHARFFSGAPVFDAEENALELKTGELDLPLIRSDRALFAHLKAELERLALAARRQRVSASFSERASDVLTRQLPSPPRVAAVARSLGVSARSLQRHLADEGTTFAAVTEGVRRGLAEAMLADRTYSIAEVADGLGFADPASFSRAFRRWKGAPPRRFGK